MIMFLYAVALVTVIFFAIFGMIGHEVTESENWYKILKQKGRDE